MRVEVLGGVERRRRWSRDEKMRILAESLEPGKHPGWAAEISGRGCQAPLCEEFFQSIHATAGEGRSIVVVETQDRDAAVVGLHVGGKLAQQFLTFVQVPGSKGNRDHDADCCHVRLRPRSGCRRADASSRVIARSGGELADRRCGRERRRARHADRRR